MYERHVLNWYKQHMGHISKLVFKDCTLVIEVSVRIYMSPKDIPKREFRRILPDKLAICKAMEDDKIDHVLRITIKPQDLSQNLLYYN
jgi:hypothetical protein